MNKIFQINETLSSILLHGIDLVWNNLRFLWLFWLANIVFGVTLSLPFFYIADDSLKHSLLSTRIASGYDSDWLMQMYNTYKMSFEQFNFGLYGFIGIYLLLQLFFIGGLVSVFNNNNKNHYVDFFYGGVQFFWRFLKVLFVSLTFYIIGFTINAYVNDLLSDFFVKSEYKNFEFMLKALNFLSLLCFIAIVSIVSDYTKVSLAVFDRINVFKEIIVTLKFMKHNFFKVIMIFIIVASFGATFAIIYNVIEKFIPKNAIFFLFIAFVLQQILIILRLLIKMYFYSTQVLLYKELVAETVEVEIQEI